MKRTGFTRAGFTLIEMLVVIVIIGILAALTIGATKYAWTKAGTSRAQAEIAALETALESYKIDTGIYPLSTATRSDAQNNCTNLYAALAGGSKKYFNFKADQLRAVSATATNIIDPFGRPYNYYRWSTGTWTNQATFDLWSYGPNGVNDEGSIDDIVNWKR